MKRFNWLLLIFAIVFAGCGENDELNNLPKGVREMSIVGNAIWTNDLLELVTPEFYYKDAVGEHIVEIVDSMREVDTFDFEGITLPMGTQSWKYDVKYRYTSGSAPCLQIRYRQNQEIIIDDTRTYELGHQMNVISASVSYIENNKYVNSLYNSIGYTPMNKKTLQGAEVQQYLDSLFTSTLMVNLYEIGGSIEVE